MKIERDAGHVFDPHSGTWLLLSQAVHAEIRQLRDALENGSGDPRDDDINRGRIAALREVLALADPPVSGIAGPADYGV